MLFFKKNFPQDDVGNQLNILYKKGVDFKEKQSVNFIIKALDQVSCETILETLKQKGFECKILVNNNLKSYKCVYNKQMFLDYYEITNIVKILNKVSKPFNGQTDGWEIK